MSVLDRKRFFESARSMSTSSAPRVLGQVPVGRPVGTPASNSASHQSSGQADSKAPGLYDFMPRPMAGSVRKDLFSASNVSASFTADVPAPSVAAGSLLSATPPVGTAQDDLDATTPSMPPGVSSQYQAKDAMTHPTYGEFLGGAGNIGIQQIKVPSPAESANQQANRPDDIKKQHSLQFDMSAMSTAGSLSSVATVLCGSVRAVDMVTDNVVLGEPAAVAPDVAPAPPKEAPKRSQRRSATFAPETPAEPPPTRTFPPVPLMPQAWERLRHRPLPPRRQEDNYELSERGDSGDEDDAEPDRSGKHVPPWCADYLKGLQAQSDIDPGTIFGDPWKLPCDLDNIFPKSVYDLAGKQAPTRKRRGSSGDWRRDGLQTGDIQVYGRKMGQTRSWEDERGSISNHP